MALTSVRRSHHPATDEQAAKIFNKTGDELCYAERYSDAIESYKKAIELNPDYAEAYNNLGWVYN
jgi:tetratricopeptide (TPR) repeat protein